MEPRPIDANKLFDFLTEQLDKETGAYKKGRNVGLNIARSALHDETITPTIAPPPNDPLTLEELREMDIKEWVWIEILKPRRKLCKDESAYYRKSGDYTNGESFCCGYPGIGYEFEFCDYGNTWLAYRRKPEGWHNA